MKNKQKRMWQIKQSAETDTLDMYIYGDVEGGDYFDWWEWEMVEVKRLLTILEKN